MDYIKTAWWVLLPILLASAGGWPSRAGTGGANGESPPTDKGPIALDCKDEQGAKPDGACQCFYQVIFENGAPVPTSMFRWKPSSSSTWTDIPYYNRSSYHGYFNVTSPYDYDFAVKSSTPCSGYASVMCCNLPYVEHTGQLSNVVLATNYTTRGCPAGICDDP